MSLTRIQDAGLSSNAITTVKIANNAVTSSKVANSVTIVNAEIFGAVGDGVTDDTAAIQAALNTAKYVALTPGKTYVANALEAPGDGALLCTGGRATIKVPLSAGSLGYGMLIRQDNFILDGINFDGSDPGPYNIPSPVTTYRVGVSVGHTFGTAFQVKNITVQNCDIYNFSYAGFYGGQTQLGYIFGKRCDIQNVNCYNNYVGIFLTQRFEYMQMTNCYGYDCFAGLVVQGGNNKFTSCSFENNRDNCQLNPGENDSHGGFVNCSFNHALSRGLWAFNSTLGMSFTSCYFWYGPIVLEGCIGVQIRNSQIVASPITVVNGGVNSIDDNFIRDPITPTFSGITFCTFRRNRTVANNMSLVSVYGDVYAQSVSTARGALPLAFTSANVETSLQCTYDTKKYNSIDAAFLQSGNVCYIPQTARYQVDASIVLNIGNQAERIILQAVRRDSSGVIQERFRTSSSFSANTSNAIVSLSNRMLCQSADGIDILLTTLTPSNSTIVAGGINVKVTSVD